MSDLLASIRATHRAGAKTWRARRGRSRGEYSVIKAGPHPSCKGCGAIMVQRENESNWEFWTRGTCSRSCANRARRTTEARHQAAMGRHCPFCKAEIVRNDGEQICKFEERKTCGSHECVNQSRSVTQRRGISVFPKEVRLIDDDLMNYGAGFHDHNIEPNDGGYYRMAGPAINRTLGGVSG